MGRLLREWLDENYHRAYPLDPSTASVAGTLPPSILLDMTLQVGGQIDPNQTWISSVIMDGVSAQFGLSTRVNGTVINLGTICTVALDTPPGTEVEVQAHLPRSGHIINGYIVVGTLTAMLDTMSVATSLTLEQGKIAPGCILEVTDWLAGLVVNNELFGGVVNIQAGTGITFDTKVETVDGVQTPTVTISCSDFQMTDSNSQIMSDTDLANYIYDTYGAPIRTINDVPPDDAGNIEFVVENGDDIGLSVESVVGSTGALIIKDTNGKPCCTQADLQVIIDNIGKLNERAARMESTQSNLDTMLNMISTYLTQVG